MPGWCDRSFCPPEIPVMFCFRVVRSFDSDVWRGFRRVTPPAIRHRTAVNATFASCVSLAVTVTIVSCVAKIGHATTTERGRRHLVSTWRRCTRWEFWPPWLFYPPVLAYVFGLMVKHRSATIFTAANPAILAGGFIGESKYDILQGLSRAGA